MKTAKEFIAALGKLPKVGGEEVVPVLVAEKLMKDFAKHVLLEYFKECEEKPSKQPEIQ